MKANEGERTSLRLARLLLSLLPLTAAPASCSDRDFCSSDSLARSVSVPSAYPHARPLTSSPPPADSHRLLVTRRPLPRASPPAMTPTLQLELQLDILELAIPPIAYGAFADVHEAARNLALVCRAWRAPAQHRLFEAQTFDISIAERRPGEIMRAGKSLAELVRRLAVARNKGCASVALQLRATGLLGRTSEAPLSRFHHLGSNARIIDRVFVKTNDDFAPVLAVVALAFPGASLSIPYAELD